jgi:hypothetical protein
MSYAPQKVKELDNDNFHQMRRISETKAEA